MGLTASLSLHSPHSFTSCMVSVPGFARWSFESDRTNYVKHTSQATILCLQIVMIKWFYMFTDSHDKMILHLVCMCARDQHEKLISYVVNTGTEYKGTITTMHCKDRKTREERQWKPCSSNRKKHNAKALGRLTEHYQWSWKLESQQSCCHQWFWRQTSSIYSSFSLYFLLLSQRSKPTSWWWKGFTETGQTITVTSQIHSCLCYYHTCTPAPTPTYIYTHMHAHKHSMCDF